MKRRALVTGAHGFVGRNLIFRLIEENYEVVKLIRDDGLAKLKQSLQSVDVVFHFAGENRPTDISEFENVNVELTRRICELAKEVDNSVPIVFASSIQVRNNTHYGNSKLEAENLLKKYAVETGAPVAVFRFPGIFGKWSRPNYNSVVATFCYNIVNELPIRIDNPDTYVTLTYVDDIVDQLISADRNHIPGVRWVEIFKTYDIKLEALAETLHSFHANRCNPIVERVGDGLLRALYATYLSFLPPSHFSFELKENRDERGVFVEILKTQDSGQLSFLTINPGKIRGGHYHHTKNERFLVVRGTVRFSFRDVVSGETFIIETSDESQTVVQTVPGWAHDIKNMGTTEAIVILWANEVLNPKRPDTIICKVT